MTKKDYIKIAEAIKKVKDNKHNEREELSIIIAIITELIKTFKADNPLFNKTKFEDAIYK